MKKRILSLLLAVCLLVGLLPTVAFAAEGDVQYRYCDGNGANWQTGTKTAGEYTPVSSGDTTWGTSEQTTWYVVTGDVTIGTEEAPQRVTVSGNVHLILTDGCKLTVNGGISVLSGNNLTIYGQTNGTGTLIADATYYDAGIGGDDITNNSGTITITGGTVEAKSLWGAGIGGGSGSEGGSGTVIINGGTVTATCSDFNSAGIGGGGAGSADCPGGNGTITITGGTVTATSAGNYGVGIGGGGGGYDFGTGGSGNVTITGGTVTATGNGAGIGGGVGGSYGANGNSTFKTNDGTNNGNAVIFASSIDDQSNKSSWSGVIFEGDNDGIVYGTSVVPSEDFTIPTDKALTIESGKTLTISEGVTVTNEGTITNIGKIYVDGTFSGTADNLYYPLTLVDATAAENTSVYNTKTYGKAGSEITLTPDAPQTGYEFTQWNSVPTVTISENKFTMPSAALEVTALFDPATYNVALNTNGGTINSGNVTGYTYGQGAALPTDVTKAGYTFKGWYDNESLTGSPVTAISDTDIDNKKYWAKWEVSTYNVALNTNGGTINSGNVTGYTYGQGAALPTDVTKAGYTFKGWYDNENLTGSPVTEISATDTLDKKFWAKWEECTYNVALNTNGGTINSGNVTEYTYGQGAALPTDVTRTGYTFKGWYDNENLTGSPVTAISDTDTLDKKFWAKWEECTYNVALNTNGGTINSGDVTGYTYGQGATLPTDVTKAGYTFKGWYDNEALTGNPVTAISETDTLDKKFWAKWEANTYTVIFNTNGGNTIPDKNVHWSDKVLDGIAAPTKNGWEFTSWNCGDTSVTENTTYGDLAVNDTTTSITLVAQWQNTTAPTGGSSYRPTSPAVPSEPQPSIGGSAKSWSDVAADLAKLTTGSEITITLNGNTTVPVEVIKVIADRKLKVTFVYDSVRSWQTDGAEITAPAAAELSIIATSKLKTDTLRGISGFQFTVNDTNVPTDLMIAFKKEHAGKFANLYKNVSGELVFVTCAKLGEDGKVILPDVTEKGDYVAMLCEFSDRPGDMDNNGVMNVMDASAILKDIVGLEPGKNPLMADFNGDGHINAMDAAAILKRIVGLA